MKLKTLPLLLIALLGMLLVTPGYARIYRCENAQGQSVFQDRPCLWQNQINDQAQPGQQSDPNQRHFLWKATSARNTIHLFGSIHFGSSEMYPLPEVVTRAYDGSDALVVEVNTNEVDPKVLQQFMIERGSYPKGDTLEKHLSPETWNKLLLAAHEQHLDIAKLQDKQPWLIVFSLATLAITKSGFSPNFGIDQYFLKGAQGRKPIIELESAEQQMLLMTTFSRVEQERLLKETLDQLEQASSYFRSMLKAWNSGDVSTVQELIQSEIGSEPSAKELYDEMFTKRNHAMTDKLIEMSKSGQNYFVVVGAGHMVGEEGIVELLRGQGYQVTQL